MVARYENLFNPDDVVEQGGKYLIQITFILLLKIVTILRFNFIFFKVEFDFYLSVNIELHRDEVVNGKTLTKWLV